MDLRNDMDARKEKLRVLFVLGFGELAGIQRHVRTVLRHLPDWIEPQVAVLFSPGEASGQIEEDGVPMEILGARNGHDPRLVRGLRRILSRFQPHIIHQHEGHFLPMLVTFAFPRIRLIHTEHCSLMRAPSPMLTRILYRIVTARAQAITAVSDATARSISDFSGVGRERVVTIHNAVDVGALDAVKADLRAELDLPAEAVLVGAVGRLAEQKGWLEFVEVANHLARADTRVHMVIVGEGPQEPQLRRELEGVSWAERCHFLGPRPDGAEVIAGLDLFLLTSLHEELPTTVLEAFAVGTPLVGFLPEGGMADILSAAGADEVAVILGDRDPEALAGAARELLDDPGKRRKMTVAARLLVERTFSAESTARRYAELYRSVTGSRPGD